LRTLNKKLDGLSDIVRGMEKSNNLRDKLIEGMDKQLGISFKLIRSLRNDKDKLEAEVATLHQNSGPQQERAAIVAQLPINNAQFR